MKFSFVIPTFNKSNFLKKTLEALNHFPGYGPGDYEAVVVDDGSTGEISRTIKGIPRNYHLNYVYLQRCPDSCRARARNYGIQLARGKFIIFIDDDIVVTENHLKELDRYYHFSENLVIIGTRLNCPVEEIDKANINALRKSACREAKPDVLEVRHLAFNRFSYNLSALKFPWSMTFTSNLSVPRELLLRVGGFDENFKKWGFEDVDLGYRLFCAGAKFMINTRIEAFHQSHPITVIGENNFDYFAAKCKHIFKNFNPTAIFALLPLSAGEPKWLAAYRKYQGKIDRKTIIHFKKESELQSIKKSILSQVKKTGTEIIINDYCENTDLDIWIQSLAVKNTIVSYFPQSLHIDDVKCLELAIKSLQDKNMAFR